MRILVPSASASPAPTPVLKDPAAVWLPIASLKPWDKNPRNNEAAIEPVMASLKRFGWGAPLLARKATMEVIAGHTRLKAAIRLGHTEVPVRVLDITEDEAHALAVADNRTGEFAEWSDEGLIEILGHLAEETDLGLEGTGYDVDQLEELEKLTEAAANRKVVEPETPSVPKVARSKRGEIYLLGDHRIMCSDSTDPSEVAKLMNGKKAALMNTDPPYGIAYVSNAKSKGQAEGFGEIENDELDGEKLQTFLEATIRAAVPHLEENAAYYLWHPMLTQGTFFAAAAADILISRQIIWVKPSMVFGRGDYHWRHELCFYGWRRGHKPPFYGERNQTTVWEVERENDKIHPTQKPVALFEPPIMNHTKANEIVYEPFSGSGSQIIAAAKTGRRCYAMELDPLYVDVARIRWTTFARAAGLNPGPGALDPVEAEVAKSGAK